jgi:uncharacterized protein (DUF305 family)
MKSNTPFVATAALLTGFAIAAAAGAYAHETKTPPASAMAAQHDASKELHQIMMQGSKMPMRMTGDVDTDFAIMMSMHHQQAVKMVDVLIEHGDDAKLKAMARKMKAAQQQEIKDLAPFTK